MEQFDNNFMDQAWRDMQNRLDEVMPVEKKKRRVIAWWWFAAAACGLIGVLYLGFKNIYTVHNQNNIESCLENKKFQYSILELEESLAASCSPKNKSAAVNKEANEHTQKVEKLKKSEVYKFSKPKTTITYAPNFENLKIDKIQYSKTYSTPQDNSKYNFMQSPNDKNIIIQDILINKNDIQIESLTSSINPLLFERKIDILNEFGIVKIEKKVAKRNQYSIYTNNLSSTKQVFDGFQIGMDWERKLSKKWSVSTGLRLTKFMNYSNQVIQNDTMVFKFLASNSLFPQNQYYAYSTILNVNKNVYDLSKIQYSIPILLHYQLNRNFKISSGIELGLTHYKFTRSYYNANNSKYSTQSIDNQYFAKLNLGLEANVYKNISIQAGVLTGVTQPSYTRFYNGATNQAISKDASTFSEKLDTQIKRVNFQEPNFYIGLRYKF